MWKGGVSLYVEVWLLFKFNQSINQSISNKLYAVKTFFTASYTSSGVIVASIYVWVFNF